MNSDPAKPNEVGFRHVDFIANKAEELGLYVGTLPMWGSHWALGKAAFNSTNATIRPIPGATLQGQNDHLDVGLAKGDGGAFVAGNSSVSRGVYSCPVK